jgi:hypothetical protein
MPRRGATSFLADVAEKSDVAAHHLPCLEQKRPRILDRFPAAEGDARPNGDCHAI